MMELKYPICFSLNFKVAIVNRECEELAYVQHREGKIVINGKDIPLAAVDTIDHSVIMKFRHFTARSLFPGLLSTRYIDNFFSGYIPIGLTS